MIKYCLIFFVMKTDIKKLFGPSIGVDAVFNINSLTPYSRSSIVYDISPEKQFVIIAQPTIPFSKHTQYKELHLTTTAYDGKRKYRVGVECLQFKIIENYKLADGSTVPAVAMRYKLPVSEVNIRSAFRLQLNDKFIIMGKLSFKDAVYTNPNDFVFSDISLSGVSLKIHITHPTDNFLNTVQVGEKLPIEMTFIKRDLEEGDLVFGTIPATIKIVRIVEGFSETETLLAASISELKTTHETVLNKFIHQAQVDELKRLSRRNL